MIGVLVHALVLLAFTLGGGLQLILDLWAPAFAPGSLAHGTAALLTLALALAAISLPLGLYRIFVVEQRFGFNRITPRLFVADLAKQVLVALALGVPLLLAVLWLMETMGEYWWVYVWVLWIAFLLVVNMIAPTLIAPLFNKLTPLTEGEVLGAHRGAARALRLQRAGSVRHGRLEALEPRQRLSSPASAPPSASCFFDTLVERLAPPEVEAVLAHELGHYRLHHIVEAPACSARL